MGMDGERKTEKVVITPLFEPLLFNLCNSSRCRKHMFPLLTSMSSLVIVWKNEKGTTTFSILFIPKREEIKRMIQKREKERRRRKEIFSDHLPSVHSLSKVHSFRGGDRKKELFHCLPFSHYLLFVNMSVSFVLNQSFYDVLLWFPLETTCAYAVLHVSSLPTIHPVICMDHCYERDHHLFPDRKSLFFQRELFRVGKSLSK